MVMMKDVKPLTDVVSDVVVKFCPTAGTEKIRTVIAREVYDSIFPVIEEIDAFLASCPRLKRDVQNFKAKTYDPMITNIYNSWGMIENKFEDVIMIEIQDARGEDCHVFRSFYEDNITALHEAIWPVFVSPVRERLWNLPKVIGRDSRITIQEQLDTFKKVRDELEQILRHVDKT